MESHKTWSNYKKCQVSLNTSTEW